VIHIVKYFLTILFENIGLIIVIVIWSLLCLLRQ